AARLKVQLLEQENADVDRDLSTIRPRTLLAISNPLMAPGIVDLALAMRFPDSSVAGDFYALHVRNDNSAPSRSISRNSLDVAERAAAAVEVSLTPIERYDLNFITGVLNTMQERDITEVIIGLHRRTALIDSFLGDKIERLLRSTNRMICITRCFNPLSTLSKVYVAVPKKAEFETGFTRWVQAVGNLCRHIGCPVEFWCEDETMRMIRAVLLRARIGIAVSHKRVESFDDFVLRQGSVGQDALLVVVSARRTSVSFDSDMDEVPPYLQRYYQSGNLIMIYPGQFGTETTTSLAETETMTMAETMATDMTTAPSPIYLKLKNLLRRLRKP
ncbi:MAG: hypothetical protein K2H87_06085, partial [Duncaniella sp.]|nr:hypothetical protein [Duncaniella sp.]